MTITVYEKRTCTKCRQLAALLTERGVDFERVEFHLEGLTEPQLRDLVTRAGVPARALLRLREPGADALREADDDTVIAAMVARPTLLERPVAVNGPRAVLARPTERVLEIL